MTISLFIVDNCGICQVSAVFDKNIWYAFTHLQTHKHTGVFPKIYPSLATVQIVDQALSTDSWKHTWFLGFWLLSSSLIFLLDSMIEILVLCSLNLTNDGVLSLCWFSSGKYILPSSFMIGVKEKEITKETLCRWIIYDV